MRVMWPQAKECPEPPEAERGKERLSSRDFEGSMALVMAQFQTSAP